MGLQDEVGEFYDQELFGGRAVSMRFVVSEVNPSYVEHQAKANLLGGLGVLLDGLEAAPSMCRPR